MNERITIKDIAKLAGVSPATVSFCLNNSGRVAPETRRKVLKVAQDLKYVPNLSARELVGKRSKVIGAIVPHVQEPKISPLLEALEQKAHEYDYSVLTGFSDEQLVRELSYIQLLKGKNVDGIVVYPVIDQDGLSNQNELIYCHENGMPVICVDRFFEEFELPHVVTENYLAVYRAVTYLIEAGHTRIGFIGGVYHSVGRERLKGYKDAIARKGLTDDLLPIYTECRLKEERCDIEHIVESCFLNCGLTSIVAYDRECTEVVVEKFRHYGTGRGLPFEIVGFDVNKRITFENLCVYSFAQPHYEMGIKSIELLVKLVEGVKIDTRKHRLPARFLPLTPLATELLKVRGFPDSLTSESN
jgi:LacI family transcriptional regulator